MTSSCPHCQPPGRRDGAAGPGDYPLLESLLPGGYAHLVCSYEETGEDQFRAHLKLRMTSEDEVLRWLKAFQASSGQTWRKCKTYPNTGRYNAYRVDLRCQHKTFPKTVGQKTKNTSCASTMYIILKRHTQSQNRKSRSADPHIKDGYLLTVNLRHEHNHGLRCADATQKRDVSDQTVAKLKALFERGHAPSTALDVIKYDLQEKEQENYIYAAADRSICPDIYFCYRLYYKLFQKAYSSPTLEEMLADLQGRVAQYNVAQGETSAKLEQTSDGQMVIAICTPVMRRVHTKLRQSGEIIFVESSGSHVRQNHRIFLLLTHSAAGGLPLGVLITTSENQSTITSGLQLLLTLFPSSRFFGREQPQVVMADAGRTLRQALQVVFSEARVVLCVHHQLQTMWRWLWNNHNGVVKQDRLQLLGSFQSLVLSESSCLLVAQYNKCLSDPVAMKYPKFLHHLAEVYGRREEWAVCLHSDLLTKEHDTSSVAEMAIKVAKENVVHRLKAYSAIQLLDFVTTRMEAHFVHRLTDVSNDRVAGLPHTKPFPLSDVEWDKITQVDQNLYVVQSAAAEYDVNVMIGCCTCSVGITGALCKHQSAVWSKYGCQESVGRVATPQMRKLYHEIATGMVIEEDWFQTLECNQTSANACLPIPCLTTAQEESLGVGPSNTKSITSGSPGESLEEMLQSFCRSLTDKLKKDPQTFATPIGTFLRAYGKMDDSSFAAALQCFGQEAQVKSKDLQSSETFGEQPMAPAGRQVALEGRRAVVPGRPPATSRKIHPYTKIQQGRKPLSISRCIGDNTSLVGHQ